MSTAEPRSRKGSDHPEARSARRRRPARCVVVGIGGSAGGLHAFSRLLEHLPPDTGMAFVVVSHLDPGHPSLLSQLLAAKSRMTVVEATNDLRPQANHVYVQPPSADVTIADGRLVLTSRSSKDRLHLPIDVFLQSLAAEQGQRSIAVILSGAASDGARGLTAIKSAGGLTFAQDPASAEYPSMPARAIATGSVDFVLPPEQIAAELASLAGHVYVRGSTKAITPREPSERAALDEVFALLSKNLGVDFSAYKLPTIRRRLARRMLVHRLDELGAYAAYLRGHPAELEALYYDLLITVSEFFRDPDSFDALRRRVLPGMLREKPEDAVVRLWVPGCASGEEAYSLAITLLETMAEQGISRPFRIFATDIHDGNLEKARRGLYSESITADVNPDLLQRYFLRRDGGYQVSKMVRELCVFARHDLTQDPPFPRLDLVSCRNVLIYMSAALQRRVVSLLHYALLPGGALLLGHAETLGRLGDLFEPIDRQHRLYAKRAVASPAIAGFAFTPMLAGERGESQLEPVGTPRALPDEADRAVLAGFVPPGVVVDASLQVVRFRGDTAPFLRNPAGRPTRKLLDLVSLAVRDEVRGALEEAVRGGDKVVRPGLRLGDETAVRDVTLHVVPFAAKTGETNYVVLFEEGSRHPSTEAKGAPRGGRGPGPAEAERLRRELKATRDRLEILLQEEEAANEELRAANEEILSSSEEMQSINEELETSSEELQSTNEELTSRNAELWQLSDDLNNLLVSVGLPIVTVSRDGHVRRFTPEAARLFGVRAEDVGRSIAELAQRVGISDLEGLIGEAIDGLTSVERSVRDAAGRFYTARVRPYATADHRIDGAVLVLADVDELTRSYNAERRISHILQEGFLHALPAIEGLELAAISVPAHDPELVGGDFSDVFRLPEGPVVVLLGDVAGKGVAAASLGEVVRSAVRTSAMITASPQFILSTANRLLRSDGMDNLLVTACVAVLDLGNGQGLLASAGHPPPVHIGDGGCRLLEPSYGTPLGAFESPYQPLSFDLTAGEALVFYTDGVTEARRAGEMFGEERLATALCETADRHPQEVVQRLQAAVIAHAEQLKDDMHILALRRLGDGARDVPNGVRLLVEKER